MLLKQDPSIPQRKHLTSPIVTAGSVIALKCREGIIMATDTLLSYGGLLKYHGVERFRKVADNVLVTASGEYADFQNAIHKLEDLTEESYLFNDGVEHSVKDYANYLASLCYKRRNDQNPFYNTFVIGGFQNGQSYLASVDLYGSQIAKDYVCVGFSKYFGLALIANDWNPTKSAEECRQILHKCFTVLYERDCHAIDEVQMGLVTATGIEIMKPERVDSTWNLREFRERRNEKLWQ